jgi:hypothetical protein
MVVAKLQNHNMWYGSLTRSISTYHRTALGCLYAYLERSR